MTKFPGKPSVSGVRWVARILGTLIGLIALMEFVEGLGYLGQLKTRGIVIRVGFFLVFAGCALGWFKEFAASFLILGGTALIFATAFLLPGARGAFLYLVIPALTGVLYLYAHLAGKKRSRPGGLDLDS